MRNVSATEVRKTLRPGQPGTYRLQRDWGDRLVCVRYRVDPSKGLRYTTVEIVASVPRAWRPPGRPAPSALVYVRTSGDEWELRQRLRAARAVWEPELDAWRLRYETAVRLKLRRRLLLRRPALAGRTAATPRPTIAASEMAIADHASLDISAQKRENRPRNS